MPSYAITGTSRGLGFEHVRQLSADPTNTIFALVRSPATATKLEELAATRPNIHIIPCDVGNPAEVITASEAISKITGGTLDILIHNAITNDMEVFLAPPTAFQPSNPDRVRKAFETSLDGAVYGTLWITNAMLPLIEKGKDKKIVHTSSAMVDLDLVKDTGLNHAVAYCVAKAGLNMIASKFAAELEPKGINVTALAPGWINTLGGPIPEEMKPFIAMMTAAFQKIDPTCNGPIEMEDSVRMQHEVIDRMDKEMSGKFISQHGDRKWL